MGSAARITNYAAAGVAQLISMYARPRGNIVPLLPVILGITPNTGPQTGATLVRITGYNFENVSSVTIGGAACTGLIVGGGIITCFSPSGTPGAQDVVVTGPAGATTFAGGFTYAVAGAVPVVSAVAPNVGDTAGGGGFVSITVDNSAGATGATLGGVAVTSFSIVDATHVKGIPGAHAPGAVAAVVTNANGPSTTGGTPFEYWTPAQITGISSYLDANKGVTQVAGSVSQWLDQSSNAFAFVQATGANQPQQTASVFGTLPSLRMTPQQFVARTKIVQAGGMSVFWVSKWTATTAVAVQVGPNCPLTIVGDSSGASNNQFGASAGVIDYQAFNAGWVTTTRGSGLNDGNVRLLGITHDTSGNVKAYSGTTQQGATATGITYDVVNNGYASVGAGYLNQDGWSGDVGAVVVVAGIISGGDTTKLYAWAQQRLGAL